MKKWIKGVVEPMLFNSTGVGRLNDSDFLARDQKHLGDDSIRKLNELRAKYDPEQRFHDILR